MSKAPKLLASYFTIAGDVMPMTGNTVSPIDLKVRADAVARAGFYGMGIITDDLAANVDRYGYDGVAKIIADSGLKCIEFEVLLDWFADGERRAASDRDRAFLMEAAERLGAYQIKVGGDILMDREWPVERMAESFAGVCADAAKAGTQISLEIFPASNVRDLKTANAIVEGAGAANGGLLLDIWHFTRGHIPYEDMATIQPQYIKHIELDDATADLVGTIMEDTLLRRKLPGEGEFDVVRFLDCIRKTGYDGIYGVEVLSEELRSMPVDQVAERAFKATMGEFAKLPERV